MTDTKRGLWHGRNGKSPGRILIDAAAPPMNPSSRYRCQQPQGIISLEVRVIYVVAAVNGLSIVFRYYRNVIDASTIVRTA